MINVMINLENSSKYVKCFNQIDVKCNGILYEEELQLAIIEYLDLPKASAIKTVK